jgi:diadenosine tetraphosphate (Ap4A) HIT family hydrolase
VAQSDCDLCGAQLQTPVLRESPHWRLAVNRNQNLLGKLIVVLRRHEEAVARVDSGEWSELHDHIRWATDRLSAAFAPDHFNFAFLQNQDRHVHLHVIPRYVGGRWIANADFADPEYPGHYQPGVEQRVRPDVMEAIAAALAPE